MEKKKQRIHVTTAFGKKNAKAFLGKHLTDATLDKLTSTELINILWAMESFAAHAIRDEADRIHRSMYEGLRDGPEAESNN